jgi:hypothetical protein
VTEHAGEDRQSDIGEAEPQQKHLGDQHAPRLSA